MESNRRIIIVAVVIAMLGIVSIIPSVQAREGYIMNLLLSAMHDVIIDNPVSGQVLTYDGTGSQNTRWVDLNSDANILFTSPAFTVDQASGQSGWFDKPSWCVSGNQQIQQQGKSTVAGDSPVYWGYFIYAR